VTNPPSLLLVEHRERRDCIRRYGGLREEETEWLPAISITVAPARSAILRRAGDGIIRPSVVRRSQLGFVRQADSLIVPPRAWAPHGTCESAMNSPTSAGTSPAKDAWNFSRSRNRKPSRGGRIGGTGAPGGGSAIRVFTDSPALGANAAM
jgi:hypothetical protein